MTQRKLNSSRREWICLSGRFHFKRLIRALLVVEADPVAVGTCRVFHGIEALVINALLLQILDYTHDHAALLRAVRRHELLPQAIELHQGSEFAVREDKAIVRHRMEPLQYLAERAKSGNQRMPQDVDCRRCLRLKRSQHLTSPSRTSRKIDLAMKSADRRGSMRSSGMEQLKAS